MVVKSIQSGFRPFLVAEKAFRVRSRGHPYECMLARVSRPPCGRASFRAVGKRRLSFRNRANRGIGALRLFRAKPLRQRFGICLVAIVDRYELPEGPGVQLLFQEALVDLESLFQRIAAAFLQAPDQAEAILSCFKGVSSKTRSASSLSSIIYRSKTGSSQLQHPPNACRASPSPTSRTLSASRLRHAVLHASLVYSFYTNQPPSWHSSR